MTVDEAMRFGRRTAAILRAVLLRCGIGPETDYPSKRYGSTPVDGPGKGSAIGEQWEKMLDVFYAGSATTGRPRSPSPRRSRRSARSG